MLKRRAARLYTSEVQTDHKVLQTELSNDLQVSEDTVRRDYESLAPKWPVDQSARQGYPTLPIRIRSERLQYHEDDKPGTWRVKALALLQNGQTIILDGGTYYPYS